MKFRKSKTILALFLITMVLYFTSDFQLVDIEKTAIIAAIGIDYVDEDNLSVTAQIAIPQATDQSATNSDAIITSTGKTVFSALDKIALETGWHPKLTFCNLIIFGSEFLKSDFTPTIDFLLTSNRFQNSAVLAAAEKTAKEVLSSSTPLDYISSFALQKILLKNLDKASPVLVTDIKDFAMNSRSRSKFSYLPLIKVIKTDDKEKGDRKQSEGKNTAKKVNKQENEESDGGRKGENNSSTVFDASNTFVFSKNKLRCTLNSEQTHCYNLIFRKVRESFMPVIIEKNNKKIDAVITIIQNNCKIKIDLDGAIPKLIIDMNLACEKEELFDSESIGQLKNYTKVSKEGLFALENKVKETIMSIVKLSKTYDMDIFKVKDLLYQKHFENYFKLEKDILKSMEVEINVKAKNYR